MGLLVLKAYRSVPVFISSPASSGLFKRLQAACRELRIPHGYFYKTTCERAYGKVHWRVKFKCWKAMWRVDKEIYYFGPRIVCSSKVVMCDVILELTALL
jgi:hypothetical protein